MRKGSMKGAVLAGALTLSVAACGSSGHPSSTGASGGSSSGGTTASSGPGKAATDTIKVGVLTDLTGPDASGFLTTEKGIKAGVGVAATKGIKIQYVLADTQSTAAGALAAAQQLVQQDHVFAILEDSGLFYGAAQYLYQQHVPVIGGGFDGSEWSTGKYSNLFADIGSSNYAAVATTFGTFFKSQGVTKVGVLGVGISPSSSGAASGAAISAQHAGLKVGYENLNFTVGSTDVQPVAIAMKAAGVDGIYAAVVPATGFALAATLKALGVRAKAFILPQGYGGDLLASPAGVAAAQGLDFDNAEQTVDLDTPGTREFQAALKTYAGVTGVPTFAEYQGYLAVAGLTDGLLEAGAQPTPASFMKALRGDTDFNGFGLLGTHTVDFSTFGNVQGGEGPGDCLYIAQLTGSTFHTLKDAAPVCGTAIAGATAKT